MSNTENTKKDNISPVELVAQAVEKAERAPKKVGLLSIKSANDWIEDSIKMPDPKTFFNGLIVQYLPQVMLVSLYLQCRLQSISLGQKKYCTWIWSCPASNFRCVTRMLQLVRFICSHLIFNVLK